MLDFKQQAPNIKETLTIVADAVVCLANTCGGRIVPGVADRPGADGSLVGVDESLTCDLIARGILDRTNPALSVTVEEVDRAGRRLVVVTVPNGPGKDFPA